MVVKKVERLNIRLIMVFHPEYLCVFIHFEKQIIHLGLMCTMSVSSHYL